MVLFTETFLNHIEFSKRLFDSRLRNKKTIWFSFLRNRLKYVVHTVYVVCMTGQSTTLKKDTQLNIRVDPYLVKSLKRLAEEEVTTLSQLVRKAVTLYIRKNGTRADSIWSG